jgi:2',3'-cyclic-nucleotide 2'-phosphodiesterase
MQNNQAASFRVLLIGDLVGAPGCAMLQKHLPKLKQDFQINAVIINGENSAPDGKGITVRNMKLFKELGVDVVTSGNHIWQKREIYAYLNEHRDLIRPANFPTGCPGIGSTIINLGSYSLGVINLQARTFMHQQVGDPFKTADSLLTYIKSKTPIIIVDFHGEATAEKLALAYYLDGQVSAVVGTHTHVPTADERILPHGTAYVTDLGMSGALNSMIGMKKEPLIQSMILQMPTKFEVDTQGPFWLTGVVVTINPITGKAYAIERIKIIDNQLEID